MPDPSTDDDRHLANLLGLVALELMTSVTARIQAATGLSIVQATALSALANYADGGSVDHLRHAVDLSHSATVRLVDRLAERGLVRRQGVATDQRVSAVHLTARGRRTVATIRVARLGVLEQWVTRLSPDQRGLLMPLLHEVATRAVTPGLDGAPDYLCRLCAVDACGHPSRCPITLAGMARRS